VAVVTGIAAGDMCRVLPRRGDAVVTRTAGAQHVHMVDGIDRREHIGIVAVLADVAGLNVSQILACGIRAIVAARTILANARMTEVCGQPGDCRMAVITIIATRQVCEILAERCDAVMTRAASAKYLRVIDSNYRRPYVRVVAIFTNIAAQDMCGALAGCFRAVVAADAIAGDIHVIEVGRQPANGRMAVVAIVAASDVGRVLASRRGTVMA